MNSEHLFEELRMHWNVFRGEWKKPHWSVGTAGKMDLKLERAKFRLWQGLKYLKCCPGDPV